MDNIENKISAPMLVNLGAAVPQEAVEKETPKGWVTLGEANLFSDYLIAIIEISTFTNFGKFATSTVSLAGAVSELK